MFDIEYKKTIILGRIYFVDIEKYKDMVLVKNSFISVKMPDGKYKILLGDGETPLSKLPLQDTLVYNPNEVYTSGNLIIKSHNENE